MKMDNREREENERNKIIMTVHLFTLAAVLISAFKW